MFHSRIGIMVVASLLMLALTGATQPTRGPVWYISEDDYPMEARRADQEGTARYELAVNEAGRPTSCTIIKSSGHKILDDTTCRLVQKRARFNPARDDAGNAVPGVYRHWVIWDLGETVALPAYAGFAVTVAFDGTGTVTSCAVTSMAKAYQLRPAQAAQCDRMGNSAVFAALLGRPTAGLAKASFRVWFKDLRFGSQIPTDQPVRRSLAHVVFDTTADGAITWCEVVLAPVTSVAGLGEADLCGPGAYGVTRPGGGGDPNMLFADVIAE